MESVTGAGTRCELDEAKRRLAEKLRELLDAGELSLKRLASEVPVSEGHLCRLVNGEDTNPSVWLVWKLAQVLKVPLEDLVPPMGSTGSKGGWTFAGWPWEGNERHLVNRLEEAKLVLSLSPWLDSHLLPNKMNETFWKDRLLRATREEEEKKMMWESHMSFTKDTQHIRDRKGSFEHRLLLRSEFVTTQHYADRIGIRDNLRNYYGSVKPSIVWPMAWDGVRSEVAKRLSLRTWQKLLVIDDKIAVWWLDHEEWLFTLDPREVGRVKKVLETVLGNLPVYEFNGRESDDVRRILE